MMEHGEGLPPSPPDRSCYRVRSHDRSALICEGELVIGRSSYCSLVLEHESVSRIHATLYLGAEGLMLKDEGSSNGTFVNGERLSGPRLVHPSDLILLGKAEILVEPVAERTPFPTGQLPPVQRSFDLDATLPGDGKS